MKLINLFSIKNEYKNEVKRKVLTILGIKLSFKVRNKLNNKIIKYFKNSTFENSVLMLEANDFHGEIMAGYAKYLHDLGYNIVILTTSAHADGKALCRLNENWIKEIYTNPLTIEKILQNSKIMNKFELLFVDSYHLYRRDKKLQHPTIIDDYFKGIKSNKRINVFHTLVGMSQEELDRLNAVTLAPLSKRTTVVNPHYFGKVTVTPKNDKVKFLVSGDGLRNFKKLLDTTNEVLAKGYDNFEIIITGRWKHDEIKNQCPSNMKYIGFVDFKTLYNLVEDSDFILPSLDSEQIKHIRYIIDGTSGAFQLSYGFVKPMIIDDKFAQYYNFDNSNSITYSSNQYADALIKAIEMSKEDYLQMQSNLKDKANAIYNSSLQNLKALIKQK